MYQTNMYEGMLAETISITSTRQPCATGSPGPSADNVCWPLADGVQGRARLPSRTGRPAVASEKSWRPGPGSIPR